MELLCALMVGTKCLLWHAAGTNITRIAGYGSVYVTCEKAAIGRFNDEPISDRAEECKRPVKRLISALDSDATFCERFHHDSATLKNALRGYPVGTRAEFSCDMHEAAAWRQKLRLDLAGPMYRQHIKTGCWSVYTEECL